MVALGIIGIIEFPVIPGAALCYFQFLPCVVPHMMLQDFFFKFPINTQIKLRVVAMGDPPLSPGNWDL